MPVPLAIPLTFAGVTGATLLAKAIGDKNRKEDLERLNSTPKVETIQQTKSPLMGAIESFGNIGGGMLKAIGGVIPKVKTFVNDVGSGVYSDKPKQQEVKVQPTPSPIKAAILETPTPTIKQNIVQTKEEIKPEENVFLGRSDKFNAVKKVYDEGYQNLSNILKDAGANDLESQLALDIAAQESELGRVDKNYNWPVSTSRGPFMFNEGTWGDYLESNPEAAKRNADRSDPREAVEAFLFAIRNGIKGQGLSKWNASKDVWGGSYSPEELSVFKK